jgi:hypothetical protein
MPRRPSGGRSRAKIEGFSREELFPHIKQPLSQFVGTGIGPSPRVSKFSCARKMHTHMLIPIRQSIIAKPKNGLHGVADNTCGQYNSDVVDNGMLAQRAILIFVNQKTRVAGSDDIIDVACFQEFPGCVANGGVICARPFDNAYVVSRSQGKGRKKTDGPAVNGRYAELKDTVEKLRKRIAVKIRSNDILSG